MAKEQSLAERVYWCVVQTESWIDGKFKKEFGNAAIQLLFDIGMNDTHDATERSKAIGFLADFGVKVVPLLLDALKNARTSYTTRHDILMALERIGKDNPLPPEAVDAIVGLITHPEIGRDAAFVLGKLVEQMATDIRKIIGERDVEYATERGSAVVSRTISAVENMAGGRLSPETMKKFLSILDKVEKAEAKMKPRGAPDGEKMRLERPLRAAKTGETARPHGRKAFAGR